MLYGLIAFCPREVLAIGRKPGYADRPATRYFFGVDSKNVFLVVSSVWVIYGVHSYCIRIVIYSYINRSARCKLNTDRSSAATGEIIYNEFVKKVILIHFAFPFLSACVFSLDDGSYL